MHHPTLSKRKTRYVIIVSLSILGIICFHSILKSWFIRSHLNSDVFCFDLNISSPNVTLLPTFTQLESPRPPIYFVETSCKSYTTGHVILNARQACAIESAAKLNPFSDVYVLFVSAASPPPDGTLAAKLLSYNNIYLKHLNLLELTRGTMVEKLYLSKVLHTSQYAQSHTSDLLRYLILEKFGRGTYLDLDVIVLANLEELEPNYAGAENFENVAAGILNFAESELTKRALSDFTRNYDPHDWGSNGPGVITGLAQELCHTKNTSMMTYENCGKKFRVYPPEVFYAIYWRKWSYFFNETLTSQGLEMLRHSKMLHVWNNFSKKKIVKKSVKTLYNLMAAKHCPVVWFNSGDYF